jgi:hypothetical protein
VVRVAADRSRQGYDHSAELQLGHGEVATAWRTENCSPRGRCAPRCAICDRLPTVGRWNSDAQMSTPPPPPAPAQRKRDPHYRWWHREASTVERRLFGRFSRDRGDPPGAVRGIGSPP